MRDHPPEVTTLVKLAISIFTLSLLILVAAYFLNRFLMDESRRETARYRWYSETGAMLERYRAHRTKDAGWFSGVAKSFLTETGSDCVAARVFPPYRLDSILKPFAQSMAKQSARLTTSKRQDILKLATAGIEYPAVGECLLHLPDWLFRTRSEDWPHVAHWIVSDEAEFIQGAKGPLGISYLNRFASFEDRRDIDRSHLEEQVRQVRAPEDADSILHDAWEQAFKDIQTTPTAPPSFSVFGIGVSISTENLLLMAGPFLLLLQLLFLVYWSHAHESSVRDGLSYPVVFPLFTSLHDPLSAPLPRSLRPWTERIIWLLFQLLPPTIFALAVLTRYDVVSLASRMDQGLAMALVLTRSIDAPSLFLDVTNLICLAVSMFAVLNITIIGVEEQERFEPSRWMKVLRWVSALIAIGLWTSFCYTKLIRYLWLAPSLSALTFLNGPNVIFPLDPPSWLWISTLSVLTGSLWIILFVVSLTRGLVTVRYYASAWLLFMLLLVATVPEFTLYRNP